MITFDIHWQFLEQHFYYLNQNYFIFQFVQKNENSGQLDSCRHKNDYKYDDCVYGIHGQMMKDELGCSFEFVFGKNDSSSNEAVEECILNDVNGKEAFKDIVYGIIQLFLVRSTFNVSELQNLEIFDTKTLDQLLQEIFTMESQ